MARPIALLVSVGLAAIAAMACAVDQATTTVPATKVTEPAGPATATGTPREPAGLVKVGLTALPANGDPHVAGFVGPWAYWAHHVFDGLTMIDDGGNQVSPRLAASWRQPDPLTWEFSLASVRFHDGTPVTAQDVKFSLDRFKDPAIRASARIREIQVTVVDPATVRMQRVVNGQPAPEAMMTWLMMDQPVLPQAYFDRVGPDRFGMEPVGTGPYRVTQFEANKSVIMEMHPGSYRQVESGPVRIEWFNLQENAVRMAALRTGEVHVIADATPDQARGLQNDGFAIHSYVGNQYTKMNMPPDRPEFVSREVRQAMNYAVDKRAMVDVLFSGFGKELPGQFFAPSTFGFNPAVQPYPFDVARARQLMAQAGYPNGFRSEIRYTPIILHAQDVSLIVREQLRAIGIETELRSLEPAVLIQMLASPSPAREIYLQPGGGSADALSALSPMRWSDPRKLYNNPEFDRIVTQAENELDMEVRRQLLQRATLLMRDDPPVLFLYYTVQLYATSRHVEGFAFHDSGRFFLDQVRVRS